ncbi:MAG TPA: DnaA/Hda family protein [Gemmataceae bacterium]|jgi:chromosomal replication initiator protein|nr:DnaA/Hda family protein [Gemmataceae bacterium]
MQTFARWVSLPENCAAQAAVGGAADRLCDRQRPGANPLFLHGPAGSGKTHLASALVAAVNQRAPDLGAALLNAGDFAPPRDEGKATPHQSDAVEAARKADLVVVEDLQHLSERGVEGFVRLLDRCLDREQQVVCTAVAGPARLTHLPARLTSRLASGLVVGMYPLSRISRLAFLRDRAAQRQPAVGPDVLAWLAEHVPGSGRQLDGALSRVEGLARLYQRPPTADEVAEHFQPDAEARRPTVERIAQRVGRYFQVEPRQLQSRARSRNALLPRQVGMYLARQLTELSLQQIGAYFGGRDHSTVLHACRKVEQALSRDVSLSGAVRQLHADLA